GLSGSGHDQQLLIHREFAGRIRPDVLVVCPSLNCIGRNLLAERLHRDNMMGGSIVVPKPYFTLDHDGALLSHQIPVPKPLPKPQGDHRFDRRPSPSVVARMRTTLGRMVGRESGYLNPIYGKADSA